MNLEEIEGILGESLVTRPPRRSDDPDAGRSAIVARMEDYLLDTAWLHAALEEARHYLSFAIERLRKEIAESTGWESHLPRKPADRITEADRNRARELMYPDLFRDGKQARMLLESVKRQIDRFEWEQTTLSRVYTLISGGS